MVKFHLSVFVATLVLISTLNGGEYHIRLRHVERDMAITYGLSLCVCIYPGLVQNIDLALSELAMQPSLSKSPPESVPNETTDW